MTAVRGTRWRPGRFGLAGAAWCLLYGACWVARGFAGEQVVGLRGGAFVLGGFLLADSVLAAVTIRGRVGPPPRVVLAGLWTVAAAATAGGFGLVMGLVELVTTGRVTDPDGQPDWAGMADRTGFALGAALLVGTALAWRHRVRGTCPRCGEAHGADEAVAVTDPPPSAAPSRARRLAYVGITGLAGYALAKTVVSLGGTVAGLTASQMDTLPGVAGWLQARGVDVTAVLALVGILLLVALTHRWGHALPRWLLLAPAWIGAATLAPYGVGMLAALPLLAAGALGHVETVSLWWVFIGGGAFGPYGVALAVAATSFQRRTRPRCVLATHSLMQETS